MCIQIFTFHVYFNRCAKIHSLAGFDRGFVYDVMYIVFSEFFRLSSFIIAEQSYTRFFPWIAVISYRSFFFMKGVLWTLGSHSPELNIIHKILIESGKTTNLQRED
jgi:hypothetical protein